MSNILEGRWKTDPTHKATVDNYGEVTLVFRADGTLSYLIDGVDKVQEIKLTYEIEGEYLVTDQPSHPKKEMTKFRCTKNVLELEMDGTVSRYLRFLYAKFGNDQRIGFARIKFSERKPVNWFMATQLGQDLEKLESDRIYGYGVDCGLGCFMDKACSAEFSAYVLKRENLDSLSDALEANYQTTWDSYVWEASSSNVAIFSSGWGDGFYASYIGLDIEGSICRLVTDFNVVD